ncbi:hypothetical protein [Pseudonocardia humida]|uniref:Uncharacterized protein n=1 Tax=Pseudonocardia humida TaxID=2800819 RepID=A0ABT1A7H3_9PSEU|nr:hypothetical protein [Pseudonocardia humida]MCO1658910.1 hypothetical protein [Pseudonocardia humida]
MTEVSGLLEQITTAQAAAQTALESGDVDAWMEVTRRLRRLERERDRAWERAAAKTGAVAPLPPRSSRDQARAVLTELGVPASLNQIGAWHYAQYGEEVPYKALSSLRHDERSSYRRTPGGRPWYVVPALAADTLAPVRGLLALSDWPPTDRVVGPLTHRTAHLRITIVAADAVLAHGQEVPVALDRLLWRFAASLPGAHRDHLDPQTARDSAQAELEQIEPTDRKEREQAAGRLDQLVGEQALFGAQLKVIDGGKSRAGRRG